MPFQHVINIKIKYFTLKSETLKSGVHFTFIVQLISD